MNESNEMQERGTVEVSFAAIDKTVERLIPSAKEQKASGGDSYVRWGTRNAYPDYLRVLSESAASLHAIISGVVDYIAGDDVIVNSEGVTDRWLPTQAEALEIIRAAALDLATFRGTAWMPTRSADGGVVGIDVIPLEYIRTNEDETDFWYNEKWAKGGASPQVYPKFNPANRNQEQGIVYVKMGGRGTYPVPLYAAALKACEAERQIGDYHLGDLMRGFASSVLVNFNGSGAKTDQQKAEVERDYSRKFGGVRNSGRMMFSWNPDIKNKTTIEAIKIPDYSEKYDRLTAWARQQVFTAFRANENLFGIPTASGFNSEEFESTFRLFNRTTIRPMQRVILDTFRAVLGGDYITIVPFTLDGAEAQTVR